MEQSRVMSLVEVVTNALIGFITSVPVNFAILPLFGAPVKLGASMGITLAFTVVSVVRSYLVRRFFAVDIKRFAAWCRDVCDN
ncbi:MULTISPECIES: polysaccharide biosynthesis C-terminal domain-containing protein [unclassified Bradyrhizobium]|uniref:DUF7220 family protein n=1 Tax=unclassified Bradyrhizobium TaxID=2631580 RepID=UPI0028E92A59|nr:MULTISPECIES: polysaccharide biosynthesis C-terminal domain-containing protein [unclassified Bradyrhizobium]